MTDTASVLLRMRDVALALRSAHDTGLQSVTRIQLQKLLYLTDVVAYLYAIAPPRQRHRTYKHGPYDHYIQNAVDVLAFRGFAAIETLRHSPGGEIATSYSLTAAGETLVGALQASPAFAVRWQASCDVTARVARIGWSRIVDLVYAEPTFVAARGRAFSQPLDTDDIRIDSTKQLLAVFVRAVTSGFQNAQVPREILLDGLFEYLASAAANTNQGTNVPHAEPTIRT